MTDSVKNLWVHIVKSKAYVFDEIRKYVNTGEVTKVYGYEIPQGSKVSKIIKLEDFYKMHGESVEHLVMLYPEVNWEEYDYYFKGKR